jgi:TRAP-type mannitol/chloroaromatic compound transport system permease small subunit
MSALLTLSGWIDNVSRFFGRIASWCILIVSLLAAADAIMSYALTRLDQFDVWLRQYGVGIGFLIDWYRSHANSVADSLLLLFAMMVMLGAPWTLKVNEHVRVDLVYSALSPRGKVWLDIFGGLFFLLPMCLIMIAFTWPWFLDSWRSGEMGASAGGLPRWPLKLMLPLGFFLLALQGVSELIKCWAALTTGFVREHVYEKPIQ